MAEFFLEPLALWLGLSIPTLLLLAIVILLFILILRG